MENMVEYVNGLEYLESKYSQYAHRFGKPVIVVGNSKEIFVSNATNIKHPIRYTQVTRYFIKNSGEFFASVNGELYSVYLLPARQKYMDKLKYTHEANTNMVVMPDIMGMVTGILKAYLKEVGKNPLHLTLSELEAIHKYANNSDSFNVMIATGSNVFASLEILIQPTGRVTSELKLAEFGKAMQYPENLSTTSKIGYRNLVLGMGDISATLSDLPTNKVLKNDVANLKKRFIRLANKLSYPTTELSVSASGNTPYHLFSDFVRETKKEHRQKPTKNITPSQMDVLVSKYSPNFDTKRSVDNNHTWPDTQRFNPNDVEDTLVYTVLLDIIEAISKSSNIPLPDLYCNSQFNWRFQQTFVDFKKELRNSLPTEPDLVESVPPEVPVSEVDLVDVENFIDILVDGYTPSLMNILKESSNADIITAEEFENIVIPNGITNVDTSIINTLLVEVTSNFANSLKSQIHNKLLVINNISDLDTYGEDTQERLLAQEQQIQSAIANGLKKAVIAEGMFVPAPSQASFIHKYKGSLIDYINENITIKQLQELTSAVYDVPLTQWFETLSGTQYVESLLTGSTLAGYNNLLVQSLNTEYRFTVDATNPNIAKLITDVNQAVMFSLLKTSLVRHG